MAFAVSYPQDENFCEVYREVSRSPGYWKPKPATPTEPKTVHGTRCTSVKSRRSKRSRIFRGRGSILRRASLREDPGTLSGFNGQCPLRRKFRGSLSRSSSEADVQGTQPRSVLSAKYHLGHRVLCVSKLSSLEFLRFQNPDLNEDQILSMMEDRGKDPYEILAEHQLQINCEKNLAAVLKKLDISFRITKRIVDAAKCVNWADLVIPIGGDGTFLLASKLITDNTKPVFGINTILPPKISSFTLPSKALVRSTQRKIADALQPRQRTLPWLALNEVFMGEFLAARPITLVVRVENQEEHKFRSSGVCVCTGSGSASWYTSINRQSPATIRSIVEIATGRKLNPEETNELVYKYNRTLSYHPEDLRVSYMIREINRDERCAKSKCSMDRQLCSRITVKSCGFDAGLIIDGSLSVPFNDGTFASFDIKPEFSLKNIILT